MKIARFRQPAIGALAVLLISGAGVAFAASPTAPVIAAPAAPTPAAVEPVEPAGSETDTLQQGDQTTPDVATEAVGAASDAAAVEAAGTETAGEAAGPETEKTGVEAPGDANLPGGGHADDPNDPNADHQFEGQE